jgi:hypothetical protein
LNVRNPAIPGNHNKAEPISKDNENRNGRAFDATPAAAAASLVLEELASALRRLTVERISSIVTLQLFFDTYPCLNSTMRNTLRMLLGQLGHHYPAIGSLIANDYLLVEKKFVRIGPY